MAIHTGGKKPRAPRTGPVTSDRSDGAAQFDSKVIAQFAPHFSVYVLPPDIVCLYSEDRKFFLHGELYCAVADAIGAGKSFARIVRDLGKKYPTDTVNEALKRLIERGYVITKTRSSASTASSYWASLGIPPETAERNLKKCRVRVQSINVKGAKGLGAALTKLGVRVVAGKADLTVVVVNDYLEARLAELNQKHLVDKTSWLLVQPSGIFPLVGPVFTPGKSACWACLADRMTRNREIKALLNRRQARQVVASSLVKDMLGHNATALAAMEIAKAIATDFRTELHDHIVSLDLLGSSIAKHYVTRRPQCPACGQKKLRDPRRTPAPIELKGGAKLIMTSGGYRSVSSRATVARNKKHVSALSGVVTKLERIDVDLPLNTNYYAGHNFSGLAESVDELRAGLSGGSFGKGSTAEQGEASALMEAIERYSGVYQGDEIRVTRRFTEFAPGEAVVPNDILLFSDAQYRKAQGPLHNHDDHDHHGTPIPMPFDRSAEMEWSPVWSLRDERFKYLPTSMLYFFYRGGPSPEQMIFADSNGCAAGNTREEAIVQGFLELVERDSYAIWWYNRIKLPEVDLAQFDDPYVRDLKNQLADTGRRVWAIDITSDLGVPSFVAMSHSDKDGVEFVEYGSGSHFDAGIAMLRSLTELNQFLSIGLLGARDTSGKDESGPFRLRDHPYLLPSGAGKLAAGLGAKFGSLDTREQVQACVDIAKRAGLDFLVLDQTRPDIEVPVVRVIVPGMRHFYRRFAPGRLYDVPVKLGLLDRPVAEPDLNPLHPHT
ncbi:MAG: TOMM precursor leader peptide-binding protein [Xanthobacteraceae bacterium]